MQSPCRHKKHRTSRCQGDGRRWKMQARDNNELKLLELQTKLRPLSQEAPTFLSLISIRQMGFLSTKDGNGERREEERHGGGRAAGTRDAAPCTCRLPPLNVQSVAKERNTTLSGGQVQTRRDICVYGCTPPPRKAQKP